jgi:tetratricopeptide (TPR) repeat protein
MRSAVAAAAVACAAALVLWIGRDRSEIGSQPAVALRSGAPPGASASARSALASGDAVFPVRSLERGCSEPLGGITLCFVEAAVDRRGFAEPARSIELVRGRAVVSLLPQPPGTSFSVLTSAGRVTAVGTIFSVEVRADGAVIARVIEGAVEARAAGRDSSQRVEAGQVLRLGDAEPTALSASERAEDLALLPAASGVRPQPAPEPTAQAEPSASAPPSPEGLLEQARALRARGELRRAAEVYRKLHASSPQSASGGAALVSLGELLLSSLHDAQGALDAFDAYLARGGALSREASFGRVRALRALGRQGEERRAIERFLTEYPGAPQSRVLRNRLDALPP